MKNSQLAERQSLLTRQTATMVNILRREKLKIAELEAVLLQERDERDRDIKIAELVVRQVFADRMWFDTLVDERRSMLDEDERRLVRTRADGAEYRTWDLQSRRWRSWRTLAKGIHSLWTGLLGFFRLVNADC
jgi:hypothetical protein